MGGAQNKNRRKWLLVAGVIIFIGLAVLLGQIGINRNLHGDFCARCGARRDSKASSVYFFGAEFPFSHSEKITPSPLTASWKDYAQGCSHDWTFYYQDTFTTFAKSYADAFPAQKYPVGVDPEELAKALNWLEVPNARLKALNAIGSRQNLLRIVAAETLRTVNSSSLKPNEWWLVHSNYFVICTNRAEAETILQSLENNVDSSFTYAIEASRSLLERVQ